MKKNSIFIFILTLGVFSIIHTEMGVIGILPRIAKHYEISIAGTGLLVSMFALIVAIAGPMMPLLFSKVNRKKAMVLVLFMFTLCNLIVAFTTNFMVLLIAQIVFAYRMKMQIKIT